MHMDLAMHQAKAQQAFAPQPLPYVVSPTFTLKLEGHMRLQYPASKEIQAIFDLLPPDMKADPAKRFEIAQESDVAQESAVQVFVNILNKSPQLKQTAQRIAASFGVVDGKLFYMFMLPVRSS